MKKTITLLTYILLFTITSCEIDSPTSGYQVYFACDITIPPFNQVNSFGQFITVKRKGTNSYEVTDANGNTTTHYLTEMEMRQFYYYGLGGLIIGTPTLYYDKIWVYDWACPACETARYRLKISRDGTGHATCPNCHNVYDLNDEGRPVKGDTQLWNYTKYGSIIGNTFLVRN